MTNAIRKKNLYRKTIGCNYYPVIDNEGKTVSLYNHGLPELNIPEFQEYKVLIIVIKNIAKPMITIDYYVRDYFSEIDEHCVTTNVKDFKIDIIDFQNIIKKYEISKLTTQTDIVCEQKTKLYYK